jgi:hypothetical protein
MQCVENCDDPDPGRHVLYEQPVWQTLQMFRMHPSYPIHGHISEHGFTSQLGKCSVRFFLFPSHPRLRPSWAVSGFLPVLYGYLSKRWRSSSIQLPEEDSDSSLADLSESQKLPLQRLTGRRILLLWLPALCDLAGTTVRDFFLRRAQFVYVTWGVRSS